MFDSATRQSNEKHYVISLKGGDICLSLGALNGDELYEKVYFHHLTPKFEHLQVLQMLSKNKSQRSIAKELSIAIGKVNYIAKSLAGKDFIKVGNFINKKDKTKYKYILTNDRIKEKIAITKLFIERKTIEYERLQEKLEYDMQKMGNIIND